MKVQINSGFQSGGSLWEFSGGQWTRVNRACENTHIDDGDSSFSVELPEGFRGAVVRFHGEIHSVREWIGFSPTELEAPAGVAGWATRSVAFSATNVVRLATFQDVATATVCGETILLDTELVSGGKVSPSGQVLVTLPYEWGDQAAEAFAVYSPSGEFISSVSGTGDRAPEPFVSDGGDWDFTSVAERRDEESRAQDALLFAAIDRGEAMADIARHIRASYKVGSNPLPTLRKKFGGKWTWEKSMKWSAQDGDVLFVQHTTPDMDGHGWAVRWVK
jgi:hypothetical protein